MKDLITPELVSRTITPESFPQFKIIYGPTPENLMGHKPDLFLLFDVVNKMDKSLLNNITARSPKVYIFTI